MRMSQRIESALENACSWALTDNTPHRLAESFRYALFPGGGRVRPRICLSVADAFADPKPDLSEAAAAAIEMIHCASLVHDDLPCFDGATLRRGRPTLHQKYGTKNFFHNFTNGKPPFFAIMALEFASSTPTPWGE